MASQSLLHPTKQQREGQGTGVTEDLDQDEEAVLVLTSLGGTKACWGPWRGVNRRLGGMTVGAKSVPHPSSE